MNSDALPWHKVRVSHLLFLLIIFQIVFRSSVQLTGHDLERHTTSAYIRSASWQHTKEQKPSCEFEGAAGRAKKKDCGTDLRRADSGSGSWRWIEDHGGESWSWWHKIMDYAYNKTAWNTICLLTYSTITDKNSSISVVIASPFISIRYFLYTFYKHWHTFHYITKCFF